MTLRSHVLSMLFSILILPMLHSQNAILIGHRGSSYTMPENTVVSAVTAWEEGADAVEIDVYPTADGKIAVLHDKSTKRTTGEDYEVSKTNADVLTQLDAGKWKGPQFEGIKIPLIGDVIGKIPKYKQLVVEVKSGPEIIPLLEELLSNHPKRSQIIFISFGWDVIKGLHDAFPDLPCFWLSSNKNDVIEKWNEVLSEGLDGINLHHKIIDRNMVEQAHKDGLGILAWTVNEIDRVNELIGYGIDGITTDRPGYIRAHLLENMEFNR